MSSLPFWSPLEVILPHWHILDTEQEERDGLQATAELPHQLNLNIGVAKKITHGSVDLPVLVSHAVSVVQVGEGLGCSPGLQVAGHPDGGSHLRSIYSVSGAVMMLWAPTLHLKQTWKYCHFIAFYSMSDIHFTECDGCVTAPLGWWPDEWWLHVTSGMGLFLAHHHLPPYRNHSGAPVSLRWCGLAWKWRDLSINGFLWILRVDLVFF